MNIKRNVQWQRVMPYFGTQPYLLPINYIFLVHPCDQGENGGCQHLCTKKGVDARCFCKKGFTLEEDGTSCEKGRLLLLDGRPREFLVLSDSMCTVNSYIAYLM